MSRFDISRDAGAIYHLLEQQNCLSVKDIEKMTSGNEKQILVALGWLVRDNRIVFYSENGELTHIAVSFTKVHKIRSKEGQISCVCIRSNSQPFDIQP